MIPQLFFFLYKESTRQFLYTGPLAPIAVMSASLLCPRLPEPHWYHGSIQTRNLNQSLLVMPPSLSAPQNKPVEYLPLSNQENNNRREPYSAPRNMPFRLTTSLLRRTFSFLSRAVSSPCSFSFTTNSSLSSLPLPRTALITLPSSPLNFS